LGSKRSIHKDWGTYIHPLRSPHWNIVIPERGSFLELYPLGWSKVIRFPQVMLL
jgi:hypothetical protein